MLWDTQDDTMSLKFRYHYGQEVISKRLLLSVLASFFDILGLWTPIIMPLKLLVQSAWIQEKDWDDELDYKDKVEFLKVLSDMNSVCEIPVSRYLECNTSDRYELHGFSDVCNQGYASVVYLRTVSQVGEIKTNIIFAKSRVAPTNKPTLPRLELLGALIAYRSLVFVKNSLSKVTIEKYYLWIDNQCVIHWLTGNKVLPSFINNRIKEIKSCPFPIDYRYIPTHLNPADLACRRRGSSAVELMSSTLWWQGPKFLSTNTWPEFHFHSQSTSFEPEMEKNGQGEINLVSKCGETVLFSTPLDIDEHRYSSFKRLLNITCYVKQFINLCRKRVKFKGSITLVEDSNLNRSNWPYGSIVKLNRSRDDRVRNVNLRTSNGSIYYNTSYICVISIRDRKYFFLYSINNIQGKSVYVNIIFKGP